MTRLRAGLAGLLALSLMPVVGTAAAAEAKVHIVAFALFGDQDVFGKEARKAAVIMQKQFGATVPVVRVNTRTRHEAMIANLQQVLNQTAGTMDRNKDIVILLITSHGSRAGAVVKAGAATETLSPTDLDTMLTESGIKNRIIIVSACYSGVFADALADPATLVITASDANHASFGCRNGNAWTYFGEAFFEDGLRLTKNVKDAFAVASSVVAKREAAQHLIHSNPQMAGGDLVLAELGQGQVPATQPAAAAQPPQRARCVLKAEPLPERADCVVFNGYSDGRLVGYFRLAGRRGKARPVGVAAGGHCPAEFVKGRLIAANKLKTEGGVYTLAPDCRSSFKTTQ